MNKIFNLYRRESEWSTANKFVRIIPAQTIIGIYKL